MISKTGNNNATNNFVVRIWSKAHYGIDKEKYKTAYSGSVTEVKSKTEKKFHSPGQFLKVIEDLNKLAEKNKRKKL